MHLGICHTTKKKISLRRKKVFPANEFPDQLFSYGLYWMYAKKAGYTDESVSRLAKISILR
jgi:hypothetical protein